MADNNISPDELFRLAKASASNDPEKLLSALKSRMSSEDTQELMRVLSSKKALEELLKSEQAQQLMKKFGQK